MLNSFVAVENLPRLQCALTRDDASGFKRFKASVRDPGPKIDEVILLVSFRHLIGNRSAAVSIQRLPKRAITAKWPLRLWFGYSHYPQAGTAN